MEDVLQLSNRVALITGGGSGIGRGTAMEFAAHGCRLVLVDQRRERIDEVAQLVREKGGSVETVEADVSDAESMRKACDRAVEVYGRLDIVSATAGINGVWAPIEEITPEEFDRTMAVNLRGTFLTIKYAVPHLKVRGGAILITSSVNGTRMFSNSGATAYSTSKAGQVAMAKMLAVELGPFKIRVNVICPGWISTDIWSSTEVRGTDRIKIPAQYPKGISPLTGRDPGQIEQVGRLALFLASDLADHITGEVVYIDGGSSLVVG